MGYEEPLLLGETSTSVLSRAMPLTWLSRMSNSLFLFFTPLHTAAWHGSRIARCHRLPNDRTFHPLSYLYFCAQVRLLEMRSHWLNLLALRHRLLHLLHRDAKKLPLECGIGVVSLLLCAMPRGRTVSTSQCELAAVLSCSLLSSLLSRCFQCSFFLCERWTGSFPSGVM